MTILVQNVFDEAIDVITNAIEDGDTTPVLYHLRGRAWLKMGQPQKVPSESRPWRASHAHGRKDTDTGP